MVRGLAARIHSLYHGVRRRDEVESEMREEFAHHLEMRSAELVRRGLAPAEAGRRARLEFGRTDAHLEDARTSRGLRVVDQIRFSWIDVRLAFRMLARYPMMTLVSVFALAVAIPIGLAPAHVARAVERSLPGDPANRIRAIRLWDPMAVGVSSTSYEDFRFWSGELASFSAVAAFRTSTYAVAAGGAEGAPTAGARVTAGAFEILQMPPQLGRVLGPADAQPGAPNAVVIGHDLWNARFAADPAIIGRTVHVGGVPHTVAGVMPKGFRFPSNEQLWLPLSEEPIVPTAGNVRVWIFGRLADGVSADRAQAELAGTGLPPLVDPAPGRLQLRPEVVPFGMLFLGLPRGGLGSVPEFHFIRLLTLVLLMVAGGNVALLVFARTAARLHELAVRTALGASRVRIISQIFVETLVLAVVAAGVGVMSIDWLLGHVNLAALVGETGLPWWLTLNVTSETLIRAIGFAAVSATVAGVIPAIRVTGRGLQQGIRRAAGRSGLRFGGVTGGLIVANIAVAVAAVSLGLGIADKALDIGEADRLAGIPAAEYLAVEFTMLDDGRASGDSGARRFANRVAAAQRTLVAQLQMEPGVQGLVVADALPRMEHRSRPVEVEGEETSAAMGPKWVRAARVDVAFFQALGQDAVAGRLFEHADTEPGRASVIVNTAFVERMLDGRDAIGRRVRFQSPGEPGGGEWREIVGVVKHLGVNMLNEQSGGAVYLPAAPGEINPVQIGIHAGADPARLIPRVRGLASKVDPDLRMGRVAVLSDVYQSDWYLMIAVAGGLALLVGVLLAMAIIGIYAMLSFSVSERTREIGIRSALGASKYALVTAILRRSLVQVGLGSLIGLPVAGLVVFELTGKGGQAHSPAMAAVGALGLAAGIVLIVGVFSCLAPALRVLGIQANEALRRET
jgi:predicted permease